MSQPENFDKLLKTLEQTTEFPTQYDFKFIFPTDEKRLATLLKLFEKADYTLSTRTSKQGKYTSVTLSIFAIDAQYVMAKYRAASKIEGIICL